MTYAQKERLLKMIGFLEDANICDDTEFDISVVAEAFSQTAKCPTVGCIMGWTPAVFPQFVSWERDELMSDTVVTYFDLTMDGRRVSFAQAAETLFGIPPGLAEFLLNRGLQGRVHAKLPVCGAGTTPRAAAAMLRVFLQLVENHEIIL